MKGFTLFELLVVVLIIGILAAVAMPSYTRAVEKSRTAEALILTKAAFEAEQRYFLVNDKYAAKWSDLDIGISAKDMQASWGGDEYAYMEYYEVALKGSDVIAVRKVAERPLFLFRGTGEKACCTDHNSSVEKWLFLCQSLGFKTPTAGYAERKCYKNQ